MEKVNMTLLEGLCYDEGENILQNAGYNIPDMEYISECLKDFADIISDQYFCLYNDEGEEIDTISYTSYIKFTGKEDNGMKEGYIVKVKWERLENQEEIIINIKGKQKIFI